MSDSFPSDSRPNPAWRLVFLIASGVFMYWCMGRFRFANHGLNLTFVCLFHLLPAFAIKPALRLPRRSKIATPILLVPMLGFSVLSLSAMAACDFPDAV